MDLVTRRLDEMTSREVEHYHRDGGDLLLIPFGPVSGHGALIPLGIHAHWGQALSLLVAERANGLVHPPLYTCYAGATRSFRGTGPFSITDQVAILKKLCHGYQRQGFRRVVLVAPTMPEYVGGTVAAREYFDETEKPVWLLIAERLLEQAEVKAMLDGYPGIFGETQIAYASLRILGREIPVRYPAFAASPKREEPDQPAAIAREVDELRKAGAIGFRYHEEGNHGNHGNAGLSHRGVPDVELAVRVLEKCADLVVPLLESYTRYVEWLERTPFRFVAPDPVP